jgi:hypothetical protein
MDALVQEETAMSTSSKSPASLFVDKSQPHHWIVQDPEGNFWIVPPVENPWDSREPFHPTEDSDLEPVPRHYKYMLGLPF